MPDLISNSLTSDSAADAAQFWAEVLAFCQETCKHISPQLLQDFGQVQAAEKNDGSLVTRADQWADGEICRAIATRFPSHGILSEENNHIFPETDWCWIIDPIDGTTDFTRGIPIWATSLGLLYRGVPVFGYVNVPPLQQAFYGYWYDKSSLPKNQRGPNGGYCNGKPIQADSSELSASHLFSFCTRSISVLQRNSVKDKTFPCKIRMLGASTYNLLTIAMGATLGGVEATPKIWDIAAVWAITQAAGATWVALDKSSPNLSKPSDIFPLIPQKDYCTQSYPTLVVAKPELTSIFQPYTDEVAG